MTFWGKSVVCKKIVSSPSGILLMSLPAIYLTTTLTHTHTHTKQRAYLLCNQQRNDRTTEYDKERQARYWTAPDRKHMGKSRHGEINKQGADRATLIQGTAPGVEH